VISFEFKDLAWMLGIGALLGGAAVAFLRWKLAGDFAKTGDLAELRGKLAALEQRVGQMPSHEDIRELQRRIGGVEQSVAVVGTKVEGAEKIMIRVEHQLNLVSEHLIREGR
jgi:hypothetical protein